MRYLFALLLLTSPVLAHDHARSDLNDWFRSLVSKGGDFCCDAGDFDTGSAKRLEDIDWDAKDGHYRVRLNGVWVNVPDSAVIEAPNRSGPAMVWPYYLNGELTGIRCFIPGSGT